MKAQRESIALLFFNLGARWRWVVNATPRPVYSRDIDPVPILQDTGWSPGPVWTGAENLAPFPHILRKQKVLHLMSPPMGPIWVERIQYTSQIRV
jgi:hypothetical protein